MKTALAIRILRGAVLGTNEQTHEAVLMAIKALKAEQKRGKWITKKDACGIDYQICSNCETEIQWRDRHGVILRVDMQNLPYCPNCGAKMERSEE